MPRPFPTQNLESPNESARQVNQLNSFSRYATNLVDENPATWDENWDIAEFARYCEVQGVTYLASTSKGCPDHVNSVLQQTNQAHRLFEKLHREQLTKLFNAYAENDMAFIVLKGSALAYSEYDSPVQRPRGDTDILINPQDVEACRLIMNSLGYLDVSANARDKIFHQVSFEFTDTLNCTHVIDLHWKLSNRHMFAELFTWQALFAQSITCEALHPAARRLNNLYALIHASLHRADHFHAAYLIASQARTGDRLIWLYDIYLLSHHLDEHSIQQLVSICAEKKISDFVVDALNATFECFPTVNITRALSQLPQESTSFNRHLLDKQKFWPTLLDVIAIRGVTNKLSFLSQTFFPLPGYMLAKYSKTSYWWLPILYIRRIIGGIWKNLGPGNQGSST